MHTISPQEYRHILQDTGFGELYRSIFAFMRRTAHALGEAPGDLRVSALSPGELDFTFFSVTFPERNRKYVVAFAHRDAAFELWLSGRNRSARRDVQLPESCLPEGRLPLTEELAPYVNARWTLGDLTRLEQPAPAFAADILARITAVEESLS